MVNHYKKKLATLMGAALLLASGGAVADDTEIYVTGGDGGEGNPVIFFYVEYSSNLASVITGCTGVTSANLNTATKDASSCPAIWPVRNYMAANDLEDSKIDLFELTRAALKRVLMGLGDVKIGLLMAHNNLANCSGGPGTTGYGVSGCSQGGYILKGLTTIGIPTAGFNPATATQTQVTAELALQAGKKALFDKLDALPSPTGNRSHPHQPKEVYLELFRYLTGQAVYNGFNGWTDFGTDAAFNLGGGSWETWSPSLKSLTGYFTCDIHPSLCRNNTTWMTGLTSGTSRWVEASAVTFDNTTNGDIAKADLALTYDISKPYKYVWTGALKWDTAILDGTRYRPALTTNCEKIYVVNVVDGQAIAGNDTQADAAIKAPISSGGLALTNLAIGTEGFEQVVKWLYDADLADDDQPIGVLPNYDGTQNVTSFFIAKTPSQLDDAARDGGSGYAIPLTNDAQSVVDAISNVFDRINDASTTFTSAAIPVNVFNRSEVLDNAYLALFQPNDDGAPNWVGNIKKLKLQIYEQCAQYDTATPPNCIKTENRLRLVDAQDPPTDAIASSGRITPDAITYWTQTTGYDLYDNLTITNGVAEVAGHDGRTVYRGGAGQQIPNMINADGTRGSMNWVNTSSGRRLFTQALPYSYAPVPANGLIEISWENAHYLWPSIRALGDSYTDARWPTVYGADGLPAAYSGELVNASGGDSTLLWSIGCYSYWPTSEPTPYTDAQSFYYDNVTNFCQVGDQVSNIIAYMRGFDTNARVSGDVAATNAARLKSRRWMFNDPLHSRPIPVNYGAVRGHTATNQDIRILVGSNDGYMRMLRNTNADGTESGEEVWAFMPREVMKYQKQLMENVPWGSPFHPYTVDGAPTVYVKDSDGNIGTCPADVSPCDDEALLFFGLRRGGRAYYGLDITDPDNPKFLWKIDNTTPGFSEIGLTFAQPVVRELDWGTGRKPVLIFGGGYDTNKDYVSPTETIGTNDSMGNAIYIVDAKTGVLVWKAARTTDASAPAGSVYVNANMVDSIPSEVTAIDGTNDGLVDRIYVGDTGGRVWRVDTPAATEGVTDPRSTWKVTMLLNVGRHVTNDLANDRRFFYAPDVVPSRDGSGYFDAVVIASGNREHPRQTTTDDYVYMYKDRVINNVINTADHPFTTVTPSALGDVTNNCIQEVGNEHCATGPDLSKGWKLGLTDNGEKVLATPLTLRGVIYFSSYLPTISTTGDSCSPQEGSGYLYAVALADAIAVFNYNSTNSATDSAGKVHELQIEDRKRQLLAPGIPSENVYVSFRDAEGKTYTGILSSDLQAGEDLGVQQWSTYWFEKQ